MGKYVNAAQQSAAGNENIPVLDKFGQEVIEVLTQQLGYKKQEAQRMVGQCLKRKPSISTAEDLLDEVFKNSPTSLVIPSLNISPAGRASCRLLPNRKIMNRIFYHCGQTIFRTMLGSVKSSKL
jgi:hypothetical protein